MNVDPHFCRSCAGDVAAHVCDPFQYRLGSVYTTSNISCNEYSVLFGTVTTVYIIMLLKLTPNVLTRSYIVSPKKRYFSLIYLKDQFTNQMKTTNFHLIML